MATDLNGDWHRLAEALVARRIELGYPKRLPFARAHGLTHDRALSDLENERRTRFDAATIAQVETIYRWRTGSVQDVLSGGDATPAEETVGDPTQDRRVLLDIDPEIYSAMDPISRKRAKAEAEALYYRIAQEERRRADDQS